MSLSEKRFAAEHLDSYYIYRVFEFDEDTSSGKFFIGKGDLSSNFSLEVVQFKYLSMYRNLEYRNILMCAKNVRKTEKHGLSEDETKDERADWWGCIAAGGSATECVGLLLL